MAQLVEQLIRNQQVAGSSPATSSNKPGAGQIPAPDLFMFYVGTINLRMVYHQILEPRFAVQ